MSKNTFTFAPDVVDHFHDCILATKAEVLCQKIIFASR
jgi:hypothetical protein